ncbi:MAG: hypothetical protein RLZ98_2761 [Pseudomonadota bacterium]|jgi:general secretion pathway protein H
MMHNRLRRDETGIGLLELTVVLFILSLAAALLVPLARPSGPVIVQSTASNFASVLRLTRLAAIEANEVRVLKVDLATRSFARANTAKRGTFPDLLAIEYAVPSSERDDEFKFSFRFFPDGSATPGRISFRSGGTVASVRVDGLTGTIALGSTQ